MFKRETLSVAEVLRMFLRQSGIETPLMEHRLLEAWPDVAGGLIGRYTEARFIRNSVLWVKVKNASLRNDLVMMRGTLVARLNGAAGAQVITDIHFF